MSTLTIRLAKKRDGATVLVCTRPDGSRTWQRHRRHAAFFPLHDLTHVAVEATLGLRYGFYGLIADGWAVTDFGERAIPEHAAAEAAFAEAAVGLLDGERATGHRYDAEAFNSALAASLAQVGCPDVRPVTSAELGAIRARWRELAGRWGRVPVGGEMEVAFELAPAGAVWPPASEAKGETGLLKPDVHPYIAVKA